MATLRTNVTEIVTGLAMLDDRPLDESLPEPLPAGLRNVTTDDWSRLRDSYREGVLRPEFRSAWSNGRRFRNSREGLRGRSPMAVEWKGGHNPPAYETVPADLRVDHVYLISCKYGSEVVHNLAPTRIFDSLLEPERGVSTDWYQEVAPGAFAAFYDVIASTLDDLPNDVADLTTDQRLRIKTEFSGSWPSELQQPYESFSLAVSEASAKRWRSSIRSRQAAERLLWRMLRLEAAPYYLLGTTRHGAPIRVRVMTPWDWRQVFTFRDLAITPSASRQPRVDWAASVTHTPTGVDLSVRGHVEIRWSHGRFSGNPEAKLYLDTPHHETPGYVDLDGKAIVGPLPLSEQLSWDLSS